MWPSGVSRPFSTYFTGGCGPRTGVRGEKLSGGLEPLKFALSASGILLCVLQPESIPTAIRTAAHQATFETGMRMDLLSRMMLNPIFSSPIRYGRIATH